MALSVKADNRRSLVLSVHPLLATRVGGDGTSEQSLPPYDICKFVAPDDVLTVPLVSKDKFHCCMPVSRRQHLSKKSCAVAKWRL